MKGTVLVSIVIALCSLSGWAQDIDLEKFLDKGDQANSAYFQIFKNLIAEELKTYDYFRSDGTLDESRKIKSIFVVYQSARTGAVAEYRNVLEFNGKSVARDDSSIQSFFEKLSRAASSNEEIARINKEGDRYDGRSHSHGMTLMPAFVLNNYFRPFFEFHVVGKEKIDGRDVVVIEYKQTKHCPRIKANATDEERKEEPTGLSFDAEIPSNFRPTNPRLQGRLWLDSETAALWRQEYSARIQPAVLSEPVVTTTLLYEYSRSDFGIMVPKRMASTMYRLTGKSDSDLVRTKAAEKTFEYSKFSRPDSEVKGAKTGSQNLP